MEGEEEKDVEELVPSIDEAVLSGRLRLLSDGICVATKRQGDDAKENKGADDVDEILP